MGQYNGDAVVNNQQKNKNEKDQKPIPLQNRLLGIMILLIFAGICFVYGFETRIRYIDNSSIIANSASQGIYGTLFIICCLFVVVGWGLLFTFFKSGSSLGLLISLFTVCFTIFIAPPMQKFWFNVLIGEFGDYIFGDTQSPRRMLYRSFEGQSIQIDFYNLKLVLASCISQLVVTLSVFGKLNIVQLIINSMLFNFMWTLNFFVCVLLQENGPDARIFDDYQISMVYLFGASYGIMVSMINQNISLDNKFMSTHRSVLVSALGAFFLFLSFAASSAFFSLKFSSTQQSALTYVWQEAFISVFFAMSSSVISTFAISCLFGNLIGVREALYSSIAGGIAFGPVAATVTNIAVPITLGIVAGVISTVFYRKVYVVVNSQFVRDTFGIINILILALLGTFFFAPIIIRALYNNDILITPMNGGKIEDKNTAGWVLSYVGVSMGIGLISGLVFGLLLTCFQSPKMKLFDDYMVFDDNKGLYYEKERKKMKQEMTKKKAENNISAQQMRQGKESK